MEFEEVLTALLGMVRRRVSVAASGVSEDPPLLTVTRGTLAEGSELGDFAAQEDEAFYFCFEEDRGSGFFLHRRGFQGGRWDGAILEIRSGSVVLRVEAETDD